MQIDATILLRRLAKLLKKQIFRQVDRRFAAEVLRAFIACKTKAVHGRIPIALITQEVNSKRDETAKVNNRTVGAILSQLGFKASRIPRDGRFCRHWDEQKVRALAQSFGINYGGCGELKGTATPSRMLPESLFQALAGPLEQLREIYNIYREDSSKQITRAIQISANLLALALPDVAVRMSKELESNSSRSIKTALEILKITGISKDQNSAAHR